MTEPGRSTPRDGTPRRGLERIGFDGRDDAHSPGGDADSAGVAWAGRRFQQNSAAGDDGSAPVEFVRALNEFHEGRAGQSAVVDALRGIRLLAPLVTVAGEVGVSPLGHAVDKTQELSMVTVGAPDGRPVMPVFSSVATLARWNRAARPVPVDARRVALAAAADGTDLVIVDPASPERFGLRRPALRALAIGEPWRPPADDPEVLAAVRRGVADETAVVGVATLAGDAGATLEGPELEVCLRIRPGLSRAELDTLLARVQDAWSCEASVAERVDSLAVRVLGAPAMPVSGVGGSDDRPGPLLTGTLPRRIRKR